MITMPESKELKSYKAGMRASSKGGKHKRHIDRVHLIPDLLYAGAAAEPFINGDNTGGDAALGYALRNGGGDLSTTAEGTIWRVKQNIVPAAKDAAILAIIGYAFQWMGKKTGLNKIGTKKVKLL